MLIKGVKEFYGIEGKLFLEIRNNIENILLKQGYTFFYSGILSKKSIYLDHISNLGRNFINSCIDLNINIEDGLDIILSPEGTFRVYEYLFRNDAIKNKKGKIFYSQEFIRNESSADINAGKTICFWQTGIEIFGYDEHTSSKQAITTTIDCFKSCRLNNIYLRITDKRILKGLINDLPILEQRFIYDLIDKCENDGDLFKEEYLKLKNKNEIANKVSTYLNLSKDKPLSIGLLKEKLSDPLSLQGIKFLEKILEDLNDKYKENILLVPFIGKSWDACNSFMFDVKLPDYKYALAGGGNLHAFNNNSLNVTKSGAGIGVTRIVEYILNNEAIKQEVINENNYTMRK